MTTEKDKNLILYICNTLADDESFGSVKLNKALYFSDMTSFMLFGRYISSFNYIKQKQGPTPDGRFMKLNKELIEENKLREDIIDYYVYTLKKPISLVPDVDVSEFSPKEIDIINRICRFVRLANATELSEETHNLGWDRTEMMGPLGPKTYLFSHDPMSTDQISFFKTEIQKYHTPPTPEGESARTQFPFAPLRLCALIIICDFASSRDNTYHKKI